MFENIVDFLGKLADLAEGLEGSDRLIAIVILALVLIAVVVALGAALDVFRAVVIGLVAFLVTILALAALGAIVVAIGMLILGGLLLVSGLSVWYFIEGRSGVKSASRKGAQVQSAGQGYNSAG